MAVQRSVVINSMSGTGYWRHASTVVLFMLATVGLRAHENVPYLGLIRPVALVAYGGGLLLVVQSSRAVLDVAIRDRVVRLMLALFAWMAVTAPFALWPGLAFDTVMIGVPLTVMAVSVLMCRPERADVRRLSIGFIAGAVLLGMLAIVFGDVVMDAGTSRLTARGSLDPNDLATVTAILFPFALAEGFRASGWRRVLASLAAVFLLAVAVKTGSRGGTIALLAGAVMFVFAFPLRRSVPLMIAVGALLSVGWLLAPADFRDRMATVSSLDEDYNYTAYSGREQIWKRGRGYIAEHPVAGVGAGNFPIAEGDFAAALGRPAKWSAAHNAYIQAFAELGVIGGGIFIAILLTTASRGFRLWRQSRAPAGWHMPEYFAALSAFVVSACFLSHAYFYTLYALCALTALAYRGASAHEPSPSSVRASPIRGEWRSRPRLRPATEGGTRVR
jgi:O-antigen ligase